MRELELPCFVFQWRLTWFPILAFIFIKLFPLLLVEFFKDDWRSSEDAPKSIMVTSFLRNEYEETIVEFCTCNHILSYICFVTVLIVVKYLEKTFNIQLFNAYALGYV